MKAKNVFAATITALTTGFAATAIAAPLILFGVPLQDATRPTLEPALQKAGLTPIQVGSKWWYDIYRVNGQLPGASKLLVGYTTHNHFATAQYVFPSFMNTQLVQKVINMVRVKYGPPSSMNGMAGLGNVTAVWNEGNGMEIKVTRGWPSTTVYMSMENVGNYARMQSQIQAQKTKHAASQAQAHSNAF
jgi:hypothetical protein